MKTINLNQEQIMVVKEEILANNICYEDGCKCGIWEVELEDLGYLVIRKYCSKSSACPNDQMWSISENIFIYDKSQCYTMDDDCTILYKLDSEQTQEFVSLTNDMLTKKYGYDIYGEELEYLYDEYDIYYPFDEFVDNDDIIYDDTDYFID